MSFLIFRSDSTNFHGLWKCMWSLGIADFPLLHFQSSLLCFSRRVSSKDRAYVRWAGIVFLRFLLKKQDILRVWGQDLIELRRSHIRNHLREWGVETLWRGSTETNGRVRKIRRRRLLCTRVLQLDGSNSPQPGIVELSSYAQNMPLIVTFRLAELEFKKRNSLSSKLNFCTFLTQDGSNLSGQIVVDRGLHFIQVLPQIVVLIEIYHTTKTDFWKSP